MGNGSPTVIFDSGFEDWAPAWSTVQPQIAKWTRACSYDRAGAGFSDPGPMPRTSVHIAEELPNSKQIFAHSSSEYIQFDDPQTVISAVRDVYDQARKPSAAHPSE
jgi:hypothetical protein